MYSHDYRTIHSPSEPVVDIVIQDPDTSQESVAFTAFVDSGADGTLFPLNYLTSIGAVKIGQKGLEGVRGVKVTVNIFLISVIIGRYQLHGIEVAGLSNLKEAILGRDVLNQLIVTLNGLAGVVEISD